MPILHVFLVKHPNFKFLPVSPGFCRLKLAGLNQFLPAGLNRSGRNQTTLEKDEKLTIKIITNKKPIIEKISQIEEEKDKKVVKCKKPLNFCQFLQKERNARKVQVNIPFSDWKGKVSCKMFKKVDFQSHAKTHSQRGKFFFIYSCLDLNHLSPLLDYRETISTHENVLLSFGQSVQNHVESREVIINKSMKFSSLKAWPFRVNDRVRFFKYRTEKLIVQTENVENPNLKSVYSVKHVKKRRKVAQIKCSSCGK